MARVLTAALSAPLCNLVRESVHRELLIRYSSRCFNGLKGVQCSTIGFAVPVQFVASVREKRGKCRIAIKILQAYFANPRVFWEDGRDT